MNVIRNFLGVLVGLFVAFVIITIGLTIDYRWFSGVYQEDITNWEEVYENWKTILKETKVEFFISLMVSTILGSLVGGITTALIVKRAKVAYGLLIALILSIVSYLELMIIPNHPLWYKISIWFVYFPFAWAGSKFIEWLTEKKKVNGI